MKKGWEVKKLGEVCEVMNGGTPKTGVPMYWDGTHLWITPAEMGKRLSPYVSDTERKITDLGLRDSSARMLPPNSVILSSRAPIGHLVINTKPMATNQGCKGLVPGSQLHHKFLYYYLSSSVDLLNSLGTGATFKELSGGKLKEITIPVPPLPEQKRIVAILDKAFAAISTAKANAEKNLANARELFESYLQGVFTNPGDGWKETNLGEVCILRSGTTLPPAIEKTSGDLPYLKVADMNLEENQSYIVTSSRFVDKSDINGNGIIPIGSTIFPKRGGAIFTNKKRITSVSICMDLNLMAVTPKKEIVSEFIFYYFLGLDLRKINSSSSIPQINNYNIEPLIISFPASLGDQRRIVAKLDVLSAETKKLKAIYKQKLADLDELKKSVLQKAFEGKL